MTPLHLVLLLHLTGRGGQLRNGLGDGSRALPAGLRFRARMDLLRWRFIHNSGIPHERQNLRAWILNVWGHRGSADPESRDEDFSPTAWGRCLSLYAWMLLTLTRHGDCGRPPAILPGFRTTIARRGAAVHPPASDAKNLPRTANADSRLP